ncbi:MAG: PAS domain S-box protein [bacterium]
MKAVIMTGADSTGDPIQDKHKDKQRNKRREELLPESEESYSIFARNLPGIVYRVFVRENNRMQFFNDMLKPMTGYAVDELCAGDVCSIEPLILPEERCEVVAVVKHALAYNQTFEIEYRMRSKEGDIRHFWERGWPVQGRDGKPLYIDGLILDITERKKNEEELMRYRSHLEELVKERTTQLGATNAQLRQQVSDRKQAEDRAMSAYEELNQIFNAAVDGMCVIDTTSRVLRVNDTFCRLFGVSREEVEGRHCRKVLHCPCPFCGVSACPLSTICSGEVDRYERDLEIERSDGSRISLILTAVPFRGPDGKLIGIVENFRDMSGYRRMEESVRESEEKYSALVEQAKDGVAIIDGGIVRFVNKSLAKMGDYEVEDLIGKPYFDFVVPEFKETSIQKYMACMAGEYISSYEIKLICKDGTPMDVEISGSPVHYRGKTVVMIFVRDITEHKKKEEELQKIQKLESLGVLAGGIAHDFNNLLGAVSGNLSLVQWYVQSGDDLSPLLKETRNAIRQAKNLTQQLLTFAKGGTPVRRAVCLSELVRNAAIFALSGSKTRCEFSLPDDLRWAYIDEGQIGQVINNLIINADQAMAGGGIIEIYAENITVSVRDNLPLKAGKYIKVSVKDHGIGIREEDLPKIFDPYFTTKQTGSGLGLATTYSVIKKHGGYIRVESRLGVGTAFHIYLPALEREARWTVKNEAEERISTGQGKILFMDDQKLMRDMVARMLTSLGYEVVLAGDGSEAVELYEKAMKSGQSFAAVILDLTVPGGMGGEEAVRKLHELDPAVKTIVSSGYANDPIMSEYREHGFNAVVAKPYEIRELSEALSQVIRERHHKDV